jgi:hypothetical protein
MQLRRYNNQLQQLEETKGFLLRQLDLEEKYFEIKRNRVILQEINVLVDLLRRSKNIIPEVSLI